MEGKDLTNLNGEHALMVGGGVDEDLPSLTQASITSGDMRILRKIYAHSRSNTRSEHDGCREV